MNAAGGRRRGRRRSRRRAVVLTLTAWLLASGVAVAEPAPLFDSVLCRLLGCAVVSNGQQWQLYVLGGEAGRPARLWASSDGRQAIGTIEADRRGPSSGPGADQGTGLGVDLDGDRVADLLVDAGAEGFLDAEAHLAAFPLTATTELSLAQRELQHSFWVASNVPMAVHGEARLIRQQGELARGFDASEVALELEVGGVGGDNGSAGQLPAGQLPAGQLPSGVETDFGLRHLADLMGGPRRFLVLSQGTLSGGVGAAGSTDLRRQLVHVALRYRFAGYDLSQGMGELAAEVEYSIYNP